MTAPIAVQTPVCALLAAWALVATYASRRAERARCGSAPPFMTGAACALGVAFAAAVARPGEPAIGVVAVALTAAAGADARTGYLFDAVTAPAAVLAIAAACAQQTLAAAAAGVALVAGIFGTLYIASRGRWLGFGDLKALYLIGAAFGQAQSLFVIFVASACAIATAAVGRRLQHGRAIPFGPYLAAGCIAGTVGGPIVTGFLIGRLT